MRAHPHGAFWFWWCPRELPVLRSARSKRAVAPAVPEVTPADGREVYRFAPQSFHVGDSDAMVGHKGGVEEVG